MEADVVEIGLELAASPATVFGFLTDGRRLEHWVGPGSGIGSEPGQPIELRPRRGTPGQGIVVELAPPDRLVFEWAAGGPRSRVSVQLRPSDGGTYLELRDSGLQGADDLARRQVEWLTILSGLANACARAEGEDQAMWAVEEYIAAWNAADPADRNRHLERCWAVDGQLGDPSTAVRGRAALSAWIGHMQEAGIGADLSLRGVPAFCQGAVRFGWEARLGERVIGTGTNFGRFDHEHRFVSVIGFWNS